MQEPLAKSVHSSHFSDDYESISSQEQAQFTRQEIAFPAQPSQFSKIYEVYLKTTEKIQNLHSKVDDLQQRMLQLQRCRQNSKYDENSLQVLDENEDESEFMADYDQKCGKRQKELQSLAEIYAGLKKLNSEVNICKNTQIMEVIQHYLEKHRKAVSYTNLAEGILVLCKETHHKKRNYFASLNSLNKSVSGDSSGKKEKKRNPSRSSKDDLDDAPEDKEEVHYFLRLLNTHNLIYILGENPVLPLFEGNLTPQQLQEIKNHVEKQVNLIKSVKIHSSKKSEYLQATYTPAENCYILMDQSGKISTIDSNGQVKDSKSIDKDDRVVLFQVRSNHLWVGTSLGVLRIYSIKDKMLQLLNIYGCFHKDVQQVKSYMLIGEPIVDKVLFTIHRALFQLNVGELTDRVQYVIDRYFITSEQICKVNTFKDKYQISRNEQLNKWYYDFHPKNLDKRILYIHSTSCIVLGDKKGNISLISI